jgi:hypothetical protein
VGKSVPERKFLTGVSKIARRKNSYNSIIKGK